MTSSPKLYTKSALSSRRWSKEPNFIDMSIKSLKDLIKDTSNVGQVLTVSFTKEIQPLYAPTFADADEENETDFYLIGNASNIIPGVKNAINESSLFFTRLIMFSPTPGKDLMKFSRSFLKLTNLLPVILRLKNDEKAPTLGEMDMALSLRTTIRSFSVCPD